MKKRKLLGFMAVVLLVSFVCWPCPRAASAPENPVQKKPIQLSLAHEYPVGFSQQKAIVWWIKEVEKRTKGRVKITEYPARTLLKSGKFWDGVIAGTADIAQDALSHCPGYFPLSEVLDLPGWPFNAVLQAIVAQEWYERFKPKELAANHILFLHVHNPGGFTMVNKPIRTLQDLKGMRIRATALSAKYVELLGGTPVAMPAPDIYDALQKGVVDGTCGLPNMLKGWRFVEVTKYTTLIPGVGVYQSGFAQFMNLDKWDSLPPDIKKAFTEVSKEAVIYSGERWDEEQVQGYELGKEKGHVFITLPPEEAKRCMEILEPVFKDYVKRMEAKGLPGRESLEYRNQLIEKYSSKYPPIKLE